MSGCSNPQCSQYGHAHHGVGQSPEHPIDLTGIFNFWLVVFGLFILAVIIWGISHE